MNQPKSNPNPIFLRVNQDSSHAISFQRYGNKGMVNLYAIDTNRNCNLTDEIKVSQNEDDDVLDAAFFPSAYGNVIAFGLANGSIIFKKEHFDGESVQYQTIDVFFDENNSSTNSELPKFDSNLRISIFPPELNIGYISNGVIHIFFIDFGNIIKLIPIRRYRSNDPFIWFNFCDGYNHLMNSKESGTSVLSIWCATLDELKKFYISSLDDEKKYHKKVLNKKIVDASISPVKINNDERIAVLMDDGNVDIYTGTMQETPVATINSHVKSPVSVEWSPFGSRIAVCSGASSPRCFIESTNNVWTEIESPTE
ncbi:hypothetical protein TRFO_33508 [Tritrichomonas foetus]|uniref:Translation initiation factor beta propellor-like domain-containing protein n=1 Tax=Tritrichomonas foetus TaxID=1144522 RepID=A0A1J4JLF7_9EUKA|nr:hypothetical protein TRFO_33508 [Tritrichomonas foetus]|eukprot:OHS99944.1 hypothetical protein TRFO_33508 [Tritrichomonas foetus]